MNQPWSDFREKACGDVATSKSAHLCCGKTRGECVANMPPQLLPLAAQFQMPSQPCDITLSGQHGLVSGLRRRAEERV